MATRLKTIEYFWPTLATANDATETTLGLLTLYIPEASGVITIKKVVVEVQAHEANTTAVNTSRRQLKLQLATAGWSTINNVQLLTQSGEQYCFQMTGDYTTYFVNNWTGTSMECELTVLFDTAGTLAYRNITAKISITYEYDDTQPTHIKTVYIPLNAPVGALATSKPGTPTDTIPALDTFCPEANKTFRDIAIVAQGNTATVGTGDHSMTMQVDTITAYTSQLYEAALNSDMWYRLVAKPSFTTADEHSFYIWGSVAKFNHTQVYMQVTYEFNPANTTTVLNSLLLPMEWDSPAGGTTPSDFQRASRVLWIEEPTTITLQKSAIFLHWEQAAAVAGLNFRVGTGGFTTYTDTAAVLCGGNGLMYRCETQLSSLSRGKNTLQADLYRTDTSDLMLNVSSMWMINYTSGKAADGVGAHNHTIRWSLATHELLAASAELIIVATAPAIPETNYFLTAIGTHTQILSNATAQKGGLSILVERLANGESGLVWESVYGDLSGGDAEVGVCNSFATARAVFQRWPGDKEGGGRLDFETARRWRITAGGSTGTAPSTFWYHLDLLFTYHTITYTIGGTISGSGGGTVYIDIFRVENDEKILETSRSGDGAYSLTWYDNTANVYAVAREDAAHTGRSDDETAT